LDTLKQVDFIAAEDTRHSRKLLAHYKIKTLLISYHEHNERQRAAELIARLQQGQSGALISDAGMPGISDPGSVLIRQCIEKGIKIDVLPGPNAALTALVLSGMPTDSFLYLGFLPSKKKERQKILAEIAELPYTIILYEAPHRLQRTLQDILEVLGDREVAVARELTKLHQTVHRGAASDLLAEFEQTPAKGECCLLIAPAKGQEQVLKNQATDWLRDLEKLEAEGVTGKEALRLVAQKYGIGKNAIYKAKLEQKKNTK
jgi:16S rRNA (cytidine1402-2'-O)-methyltransferase